MLSEVNIQHSDLPLKLKCCFFMEENTKLNIKIIVLYNRKKNIGFVMYLISILAACSRLTALRA